jgi:hypothetical protein
MPNKARQLLWTEALALNRSPNRATIFAADADLKRFRAEAGDLLGIKERP